MNRTGELAQKVLQGDIEGCGPLLDHLLEQGDSRYRQLEYLLADLAVKCDGAYDLGDGREPGEWDVDDVAWVRTRLERAREWWRQKVERLFYFDLHPATEVLPRLARLLAGADLKGAPGEDAGQQR